MALAALKNSGAGYDIASQKYSTKLSLKSSDASCHIVTFQTAYTDTQIAFHYDDSYPSRVPKIVVHSPTLTRDQKYDLCVLLQRKGKTEEYSNTPLLPLMLDHCIKWLEENYGKRVSTSSKTSKFDEIREDSWQLNPGHIPDSPSQANVVRNSEDMPSSKAPRNEYTKKVAEKKKKNWKKMEGTNFTSDWSAFSGPTADSADPEPWVPVDDWAATDSNSVTEEGDDSWTAVPARTKPKPQTERIDPMKFTIETVPDIPVSEDSRRANYFVAIRCTNGEIGDAVEKTVQKILEVDSVYEPICYNRNEIHVTLTTLALHTYKEVEAAVKALEDARNIIANHTPKSLLTISGIDNFQGSKVVYGKVKAEEDVYLFRKVIQWAFKKAGIAPRDNFDYHPHMTIVKTNMTFTRNTKLTTVARCTYEPLLSTYFGEQGVKAIHLCKMGKERGPDGFYLCPTKLDLRK